MMPPPSMRSSILSNGSLNSKIIEIKQKSKVRKRKRRRKGEEESTREDVLALRRGGLPQLTGSLDRS